MLSTPLTGDETQPISAGVTTLEITALFGRGMSILRGEVAGAKANTVEV
jgi:hypothetical protein